MLSMPISIFLLDSHHTVTMLPPLYAYAMLCYCFDAIMLRFDGFRC